MHRILTSSLIILISLQACVCFDQSQKNQAKIANNILLAEADIIPTAMSYDPSKNTIYLSAINNISEATIFNSAERFGSIWSTQGISQSREIHIGNELDGLDIPKDIFYDANNQHIYVCNMMAFVPPDADLPQTPGAAAVSTTAKDNVYKHNILEYASQQNGGLKFIRSWIIPNTYITESSSSTLSPRNNACAHMVMMSSGRILFSNPIIRSEATNKSKFYPAIFYIDPLVPNSKAREWIGYNQLGITITAESAKADYSGLQAIYLAHEANGDVIYTAQRLNPSVIYKINTVDNYYPGDSTKQYISAPYLDNTIPFGYPVSLFKYKNKIFELNSDQKIPDSSLFKFYKSATDSGASNTTVLEKSCRINRLDQMNPILYTTTEFHIASNPRGIYCLDIHKINDYMYIINPLPSYVGNTIISRLVLR